MPISGMPQPKPGQPLTAAFFEQILSRLVSRFVGGKNIAIRTLAGGKILIDCTAPYVRGGGGGQRAYVVENYAQLPAPTKAHTGDLGYTQDHGNLYGYTDRGWQILHPFRTATAPENIGEKPGDMWEYGGRVCSFNGTAWIPLPTVVNGKIYMKPTPSGDPFLLSHLE